MMRVAGGPRSSSRPLLLVLERALAVHKVHQQSKKNLPHCTPDARHATRRRGGRPVSQRGASSSRWEASGPGFRALAGSRRPHGDRRCQRSCRFAGFGLDCARGPHPGGRLFLFGQRVESRLRKTTRPGRALSGDRAVQRGLPVYWHRKSELSVTSARREITPRFRVHRRETGPRPSVWRSRPTRESKNRSAPRDSTDAHGVSDRTRARNLLTRALDFEIGLRVTHSDGSGRVIISDGRKLAPPWKVRGRASDLLRPADGRAPSRAHGGPGGLQGVGDQDPGSSRR